MRNEVEPRNQCRMCKGASLVEVFDLGEMPLANAFLKKEDLSKPEPRYPLRVLFCKDCHLSQLSHVVDPEILFRDYVYFSSGMPVLPEHFRKYAEEVAAYFTTSQKQFVVEIGSNDGLLLGAIKSLGTQVLGVDPAVNIARVANDRGVPTLAEFFSEKLAHWIAQKYGKAQVVVGNNVVAHIDDHHDLVKGVHALLDENGVFIVEAPYLVDMFENLTFDTIYHEHLSYLSVSPLQKFFEKFGMEIFDVKIFPVQGSSLRVYAGKKGRHKVAGRVASLLEKEKEMKLGSKESYRKLAKKIEKLKREVVVLLKRLKKQGKRVAAYGAPAKGNTLLNYFGIGPEILDYATEGLPSKIGLYTPGTHVVIVNIEEARKKPPDFYLLLAWNYKDAILEKEKEFIKNGGRFIVPVGNLRVI